MSMAAHVTMIAFGLFAQSRIETVLKSCTNTAIVRAILMTKPHHTFYETLDSKGRRCIRLDKRNGRILARWRDDTPGQWHGYYQWVREKNAVLSGYGDICFDAMHAAVHAYGLSDFDPLFSIWTETIQYDAVFIPLEETQQTLFGEIAGY